MSHVCTQTHRLFILERDLPAETAARTDSYRDLQKTLAELGKAIASLGENTAGDLKALRKEIAGLARVVKKNGG